MLFYEYNFLKKCKEIAYGSVEFYLKLLIIAKLHYLSGIYLQMYSF